MHVRRLVLLLWPFVLVVPPHALAQEATTMPAPLSVPKVTGVAVDGSIDDWGDRGLRVDVLTEAVPTRKPFAAGDAAVRLGWDDDGLLVRVDVTDDAFVESDKDDALWERDGVELFVATADARRRVQFIYTAGLDPDHPKPRVQAIDHRAGDDRAQPLAQTSAVAKTQAGYVLEASIPWSNLGVAPAAGVGLRVQVYVNDNDAASRNTQLQLHPQSGASGDPSRMAAVALAGEAAASSKEPVAFRVAASGAYERFRRARVNVGAAADAAGKPIEVRDAGRTLAGAVLVPQGRLAVASLVLPMPADAYGPLEVTVDGKSAGLVALPDPRQARADAIDRLDVAFEPGFVFNQAAFPQPEFENQSLAEDLMGPYSVAAEFYDGAFRKVVTADKPGRYGAIVSISPDDGGPTFKRFFTLYRAPDKINWREQPLPAGFELPAAWGIDADVARDRWRDTGDVLKSALRQATRRGPDLSIFLAGLSETRPGTPPLQRYGPGARDEAYWYDLKKRTGDLAPYRYNVSLPEGYVEGDKTRTYPTILFLHGSGERGRDLKKVLVHGPPKAANAKLVSQFIVIAPQCPLREWWSTRQLRDLLDEVRSKYPIDPDRLYLSGLSMGGFGAWQLAADMPETFAAVVPVCGGGDPLDVAPVKDLPVWVFHGGRDEVVVPESSYRMVAALRDVQGRVRFTLYPNAGHDSWTATYANPALYQWLLQQRRGAPQEPRATEPGTQPTEIGKGK